MKLHNTVTNYCALFPCVVLSCSVCTIKRLVGSFSTNTDVCVTERQIVTPQQAIDRDA